MTNRAAIAGMLIGLALASGAASATPADCLSYRDNPHVAACANQYGGPVAPRHATTPAVAPLPQAARVTSEAELRSVPVVVAAKITPAASAPEPETPMFAVDRQVLTNTVIVGAAAGTLLILVALGVWRWGAATFLKDCPWCSSKISRSAQTCPRCFRQL